MPLLDVNDAFDSQMLDPMTVIRRTMTVTSKGRTQVTETVVTPSPLGVITAASPDDLARLPEAEYQNRAISIYTPFRLQGATRDEAGAETLPDHVLYHGAVYVVRALDDFSGYGRGFVSAVAVAIEPVGPAPIPQPRGSA